MSKYFNKEILDNLEERFNDWSQNPPPQYDTAPDGGVFIIFLSNDPEDVVTDKVFNDTVNALLLKPEPRLDSRANRFLAKDKKDVPIKVPNLVADDTVADQPILDFYDAMVSVVEFESSLPSRHDKAVQIYEEGIMQNILRPVVRPPPIFGPTIDEPLTVLAYYSFRMSAWIIKTVTKKLEEEEEEEEPTNQLTDS